MFLVRGLKIFFTTRHSSLREALDAITRDRVERAITDSWTALRVLGHAEPRLAVAAVNPHGGEGGTFGTEEIEHIAPACEAARENGMPVAGPVPADSVFHQGLQGRYDAVLSHFHDQGHIAAKTVDFEGAVTVTMGLPIIRTSVDHGTAYDIAGTGTASHGGMLAATQAAARTRPARGARARRVWLTTRRSLSLVRIRVAEELGQPRRGDLPGHAVPVVQRAQFTASITSAVPKHRTVSAQLCLPPLRRGRHRGHHLPPCAYTWCRRPRGSGRPQSPWPPSSSGPC